MFQWLVRTIVVLDFSSNFPPPNTTDFKFHLSFIAASIQKESQLCKCFWNQAIRCCFLSSLSSAGCSKTGEEWGQFNMWPCHGFNQDYVVPVNCGWKGESFCWSQRKLFFLKKIVSVGSVQIYFKIRSCQNTETLSRDFLGLQIIKVSCMFSVYCLVRSLTYFKWTSLRFIFFLPLATIKQHLAIQLLGTDLIFLFPDLA